ncbi:MAG: filamentous hemagglutinin N-terminal domain-containing protein [Methylococcaceae bacterium]
MNYELTRKHQLLFSILLIIEISTVSRACANDSSNISAIQSLMANNPLDHINIIKPSNENAINPHAILDYPIITDGSVGSVRTLTGDTVIIPQNLGTTIGHNLLHSFAQFNINTGQSVSFTENTPNYLDNIITRVTGGSISTIDGLLQATPTGHANFYLINPAGIIFDKNASVDVPASLYLSTANELQFTNGDVLTMDVAKTSHLSAATPEAYGFLKDRSADIQFLGNGGFYINDSGQYAWQGSEIQLNPSNTLDISAGAITINATQLNIPQGFLNLTAQQGRGTVAIGQLTPKATGGDITINNSHLDTSGDGAGLLALRGGLINIDNSFLQADNLGNTNATLDKGVNIQADNLNIINGSGVTTDNYGTARTGEIVIDANNINILNGGAIGSIALSEGNAGSITLTAKQLTINGQANENTGIYSITDGFGNTGQIKLNVDGISILSGGKINSLTYAEGHSNKVLIKANDLTIDGGGAEKFFTGIATTALVGSTGNAGLIDLNITNNLKIVNSGELQNITYGKGEAGQIIVNAKHISLDGHFTDISSAAKEGSLGQTGDIIIHASEDIHLSHDAEISMRNRATIDQPNNIRPTSINISSPVLIMDSSSKITTESLGNIAAGNITIAISNWLRLNNAQITSSALGSNGNGGNITLSSPVMVMETGFIQANTLVKNAHGGLINIDVNALIPSGNQLSSGGNIPYLFAQGQFGDNVIQASAPNGLNGVVTINAPQLNLSGVLTNLSLIRANTDKLSEDFCATNKESSLTKLGRGGLLPKAGDSIN